MYQLTEKLQEIVPYAPILGEYKLRLDANESYFSAPEWLRQEIAREVSKIDFHRYPDPLCTKLREAYGAFLDVNPALITAGNGSDELINILIQSFLLPGECLALTTPDFSMYRIYGEAAGVPMAFYQKEPDLLQIDVDSLIAFTKQHHSRMLLLSNPCNPTSQELSLNEVRRLVENLDCLVVIDEAYMEFSEGSILPFINAYDNLVVLKTCSKMGMAAIRLGFAIANPVLTKALQGTRSPYNVNEMTQVVGCVWLSHKDYIHQCIAKIRSSRDALYETLCKMRQAKQSVLQIFPSCGNFVFMHLANAKDVYEVLLSKGIAVRHMGEYLRITAGSPTENELFLKQMEEILR